MDGGRKGLLLLRCRVAQSVGSLARAAVDVEPVDLPHTGVCYLLILLWPSGAVAAVDIEVVPSAYQIGISWCTDTACDCALWDYRSFAER